LENRRGIDDHDHLQTLRVVVLDFLQLVSRRKKQVGQRRETFPIYKALEKEQCRHIELADAEALDIKDEGDGWCDLADPARILRINK